MTRTKDDTPDGIAMMRKIRNNLSRKLMTLTHQEQQRYIQGRLAEKSTDHESKPRRRSRLSCPLALFLPVMVSWSRRWRWAQSGDWTIRCHHD